MNDQPDRTNYGWPATMLASIICSVVFFCIAAQKDSTRFLWWSIAAGMLAVKAAVQW